MKVRGDKKALGMRARPIKVFPETTRNPPNQKHESSSNTILSISLRAGLESSSIRLEQREKRFGYTQKKPIVKNISKARYGIP